MTNVQDLWKWDRALQSNQFIGEHSIKEMTPPVPTWSDWDRAKENRGWSWCSDRGSPRHAMWISGICFVGRLRMVRRLAAEDTREDDIVRIHSGMPIATAKPTIAPYCSEALELAAPRICQIHRWHQDPSAVRMFAHAIPQAIRSAPTAGSSTQTISRGDAFWRPSSAATSSRYRGCLSNKLPVQASVKPRD